MALSLRIDLHPTIQWKVEKGSWSVLYVWMWLRSARLLEAFNNMTGDEQYELLVAEFGED